MAQQMINEVVSWREMVVNQSEEIVVDMVRRIARLMFGEGLQLDKSALQMYLNEVMETTRSLGEIMKDVEPKLEAFDWGPGGFYKLEGQVKQMRETGEALGLARRESALDDQLRNGFGIGQTDQGTGLPGRELTGMPVDPGLPTLLD